MNIYERIGKENTENFPELEVAEGTTAKCPDTVLLQGTWETDNGEFLLELEGHPETHDVLWIRVSDFESDENEVIGEIDCFPEFAERYPVCADNIREFLKFTTK